MEEDLRGTGAVSRRAVRESAPVHHFYRCRMGALVRHFAMWKTPAGHAESAIVRSGGSGAEQFRRPTAAERELMQAIADELRTVDYKAAGALQRISTMPANEPERV